MRGTWRAAMMLTSAALVTVVSAASASGAIAAPTVSGGDPPQVGAVLTATPALGLDSISWETCTSSGTGTGSLPDDTDSYTLALADADSYVCAVESGLEPGTSAPVGPVAGLVAADRPVLSVGSGGAVAQGQTLTVTQGDWGAGADVTDIWLDCNGTGGDCARVASRATGTSYTVARSDAGRTIEVLEEASDPGDPTTATTSAATGDATATAPSNTSRPTVSGTAAVGQTLTASTGAWSNDPTAYAYAWQRCSRGRCATIPNATGRTYQPSTADVGSTLEVVVAASVLSSVGELSASSPTHVVTLTRGAHPSGAVKLDHVSATMQWMFYYTPLYTQILRLEVQAPALGSRIMLVCTGRGCPFARHATTVRRPSHCRHRTHAGCPAPATVNLASPFRHRDLRVGDRLTVTIAHRHDVSKYYRFVMRARRAPSAKITCVVPGSRDPGRGCTP